MLLILNVLVSGLDEFGAGEHVGFHEARRLLDRLGSKDSLLHSVCLSGGVDFLSGS